MNLAYCRLFSTDLAAHFLVLVLESTKAFQLKLVHRDSDLSLQNSEIRFVTSENNFTYTKPLSLTLI